MPPRNWLKAGGSTHSSLISCRKGGRSRSRSGTCCTQLRSDTERTNDSRPNRSNRARCNASPRGSTFEFDLLGRLKKRTEAEGISEWTWGTSSTAKNIGRLESVAGLGYLESYSYDSVGRPSSTSISADATYQINYSYNTIGALDTLTYPTSTSSYRLKLQYEYLNGYLHLIKDFNAPSTIFWTGNTVNARNQLTRETLGNGLVTNRGYDAVTG